jgi:hypothetical protein
MLSREEMPRDTYVVVAGSRLESLLRKGSHCDAQDHSHRVSDTRRRDGGANEWSFPYWNDEIAKFKQDELFASDALLLGRVTYDGFADRMNGVAKYVVSTTVKNPN